MALNFKPPAGARVDWSHNLSCGLLGWWLFNENGGNTAFDIARNNDGTLTNGPTWVSGKFGPALNFDGTADYVNVTDDNSLDVTTGLTLSAWIKTTWNSIGTKQIITKDTNGTNTRSFGLLIGVGAGLVSAAIFKTGNSETRLDAATGNIANGNWHFVAATYRFVTDGTSVLRIYVDGIQVAVTSLAKGPILVTTTPVNIGRRPYAANENYFPGSIDNARIYNRQLSDKEVKELYVSPFAGLVQPRRPNLNEITASVPSGSGFLLGRV